MIRIIKNIDKKLLIVSILLFLFGLVMIFSASNVTAFMLDAAPERFFLKQAIFLGLGFLACAFFIRFSTKTYPFIAWFGIIIITVAIVCLVIFGESIKGVNAWFSYNGLGIQPSEIAKIVMIPLIATYYELNIKKKDDFIRMMIPLILTIVLTIAIVLQDDYGTALIFLVLSISLFFMSPVSKKIKSIIFFVGLGAMFLLVFAIVVGGDKVLPKDKLERFTFERPCDRYLSSGNQVCNGYIAINGGGIFGKGLGNSTQKFLYLPEGHTDFIFAIIIEELGIIGGAALFGLYFYLIVRIIVIGKKSLKKSHQVICFGVALYFFLHIVINLGGVLGLIPLTGIPLPFMSYGGTFCWASLGALTLVQRVSYETKIRTA